MIPKLYFYQLFINYKWKTVHVTSDENEHKNRLAVMGNTFPMRTVTVSYADVDFLMVHGRDFDTELVRGMAGVDSTA